MRVEKSFKKLKRNGFIIWKKIMEIKSIPVVLKFKLIMIMNSKLLGKLLAQEFKLFFVFFFGFLLTTFGFFYKKGCNMKKIIEKC